MDATEVLKPKPLPNQGGIRNKLYYACIADFDLDANGIPSAPGATAADFATAPVLAADFTFKVGKAWRQIDITQKTGKLIDNMVGPIDGKAWERSGEFSIPGNEEEALGFAAFVANNDLLVLYPEANGKVRLVGSEHHPAWVEENNFDSGGAAADGRKQAFKVMAEGDQPAPIYEGTIQTTDQV